MSDWSSDVCCSDLEGEISTLYLPRLLYWRVSSWVTRSRLRRLKVSPSDRPMSDRPLSSSSVWMSLLPVSVSLLIDGRSTTFTTRMSPWRRSEEHTSELQSLMRISYAVFCLKKKKKKP